MTDESRALTTQAERPMPAPRSYLNVEEAIPILDTARFEHMQRISTIMASSALIPDCLRGVTTGEGNNKKFDPYPLTTVISNCFLVTEQAVRWNMSPFAVAQCCSIVHGRLMYEGKLVAAVLQARAGIDLDYIWGRWDSKTERCIEGPEGEADMLGVIVREKGGDREVHGSVGTWKTTGAGTPWRAGAMKRQCRYRGAREWNRAYEPGLMLGVVTDDEMDDLVDRRFSHSTTGSAPALIGGEGSGLAARLANQGASTTGFDAAKVASETGGEKPKGTRRKAATPPVADDTAKSAEAPDVPQGAEETTHNPETGEIIDAKVEEIGGARLNDDKTTDNGDEVSDGVAGPGEVYFHVGVGPADDGRRATFKDGKPFSSAKADNADIFVYRDHAPAAEDDGFPGDKKPEGEQSGAETTSKSPDSSEGSQEVDAPYTEMAEGINAAAHWLGIKQVLKGYGKTDAWKDEAFRAASMQTAWRRFAALQEDGAEDTEVFSDYNLFQLWLNYGAKSSTEIDAVWPTFYRGVYKGMGEIDQKKINDIRAKRKAELAG